VFEATPSREEIAFFQENGFLAVERITSDEELTWMRQIYEFIFSPEQAGEKGAPIDRSGTKKAGEAKLLSKIYFPEMRFPELLKTSFHRNAKRYAAALLGVGFDELSSWGHMIRKAPGGRATLWHQDEAYWEPELDFCALGVWLPMDAVTTEMGAMQFIPGSHKRGILPHKHDDDPALNILTVDDAFDINKAVSCPLPAGGATFHHSRTIHYTAPNTTNVVRLAYPIEVQTKPVRRAVPRVKPWVDVHRAAIGSSRVAYVADGKVFDLT
jgi:ectoine hydroxylase-related dioxygenase (phytanoyl-CoA dioxygenase family)